MVALSPFGNPALSAPEVRRHDAVSRTLRPDLGCREPGVVGQARIAEAPEHREDGNLMPTSSPGFLNTRANLIAKAKPLLESDEIVAHVVRGMEGPNRWVGVAIAFAVAFAAAGFLRVPFLAFALFIVLFTSLYPRRLVLATDRSLVVLQGGRWRWTPRKVLDRLDIETKIGPLKGFWRYATLGTRRVYIAPRSYTEVQAADADVDAA